MYPMPSPSQRRTQLLQATMRSAFESLLVNRTRSLLTMLGVIVGVAAVLTAVTLTQGASALVTQRIASLGNNTLFISAATSSTGGRAGRLGGGLLLGNATTTSSTLTLTRADADAIAKLPHTAMVTPRLTANAQVVYRAVSSSTSLDGVYPAELQIGSWSIASGRWITQHDENAAQPFVVLGATTAADLFASPEEAVNKSILLQGQAFVVIGVLQSKGGNQDTVAFLPFSTMQTRIDNAQFVNAIDVKVDSAGNLTSAQDSITTLLRSQHHIAKGQPGDFRITSSNQIASVVNQTTGTLTALLVSVAAISLVVGGIGIMNIMLVSVTERTREIGIRMAVGARRSAIRNQFLVEAVFLSGVGGILGILIGLFLGYALTSLVGLPFGIDAGWTLLAFAVSALVGILFGYYPAARAAQLDPISALRAE